VIRYAVPAADLERLIRKESPDWIENAAEQTRESRKARQYVEGRVNWSAIKQAFISAQQGKCIYCERKIGDASDKKVEWDVEHYRPKGRVRKWTYTFDTGPAADTGYYLLALDWRNYMASCKRCNSTYKKDYFPIARPPRQLSADAAARLEQEGAYLPFPLGAASEDPQEWMTFLGVVPKPKTAGVRKRADLVIRFFDLDVSEDLIEARATALVSVYTFLRNLEQGDEEARKDAADMIAIAKSDRFPHAGCVRAFVDLYERDPDEARKQKDACVAYLKGKFR
jgi:hypothetical protein